jgi:cytochrome c biogenesis protein CcmG, thiol:disulfide interchange protein DsbE
MKENPLSEKAKPSSNRLMKVVIGLWIGIFIGAALIVALVLMGTISLGGSTEPQYAPLAKMESGSLANDFQLEDTKGNTLRLSDQRGKVVVLNYWATWCIPCIEEMPMFEAYSTQYPKFTMIGIDQAENRDKVAPFIERMGITYPIVLDLNAKVSDLYKVFMLPTTLFIDQEGMIRFRHYGIMSQDQFKYYLQTLGAID